MNYPFKKISPFFILLSFFSVIPLFGKIILPPVFSDNMMLQRDESARIWGTATEASLKVTFNGKTYQVPVQNGKWEAKLEATPAGGPHEMFIQGEEEVRIKNILVGEVWIAAGQSNMVGFMMNTDGKELLETCDDPQLRLFTVNRQEHPTITESTSGKYNKWFSSNKEDNRTFSTVAYHFAKNLRESLQVPVGIVSCNYGASSAETWMSPEKLKSDPQLSYLYEVYKSRLERFTDQDYQAYLAAAKEYEKKKRSGEKVSRKEAPENQTAFSRKIGVGMYESMMKTIIPYTVKGVIWYQGENNAKRGVEYEHLFAKLIENWRELFQKPNLPFYFVQLSNYGINGKQDGVEWPELRESQRMVYLKTPHTGMAVSIDVGDEDDIHPKRKRPVGLRLAAIARKNVYGEKTLVDQGPMYKSMEVKEGKLTLLFENQASKLVAPSGKLTGFTIAGADEKFYPANGEIKGNTIILWSDQVPVPVAARYCWRNYADFSLFDDAGFPASPFRTDQFAFVSFGEKSDYK